MGKESPTYSCEGSSGGTETTLWDVQLRNRDPIPGKVKREFRCNCNSTLFMLESP